MITSAFLSTTSIVSWIVDRLHSIPPGWVYVVVGLLVFAEAALFVGFVLPGETAVLVGGVIASQGRVNVVALAAVVVVSAILGDSTGYFVGEKYGQHLLDLPLIRSRRAGLERALEGLRTRGPIYVFIGRFTAFLRAVMPGLAGMSRMHYRTFLAANVAGALVWGIGFTLLGYFAGHALHTVEKYSTYGASALLVIAIVVAVVLHRRSKAKELKLEQEWEATHPDDSLELP